MMADRQPMPTRRPAASAHPLRGRLLLAGWLVGLAALAAPTVRAEPQAEALTRDAWPRRGGPGLPVPDESALVASRPRTESTGGDPARGGAVQGRPGDGRSSGGGVPVRVAPGGAGMPLGGPFGGPFGVGGGRPLDAVPVVPTAPAWPPVATSLSPPRQFVYPGQGQSAEEQAEDEQACHAWAVQRSGHDPVADGAGVSAVTGRDDAAEARAVEDHARARAACLEGRGYTVR